jgi:hypothetical protein
MRFKHGHLCNIAAEAGSPAPATALHAGPCFHLDLENPVVAEGRSGHEQVQRLVNAHDAGESLPVDALAHVIDALRVFIAHGELETQLNQFALDAGLTSRASHQALATTFEPMPRQVATIAPQGTTTLEAARNLHCRVLNAQANMTRLGAALRETMGIVVRMKRATRPLCEPCAPAEAVDTGGPDAENGMSRLAKAVG